MKDQNNNPFGDGEQFYFVSKRIHDVMLELSHKHKIESGILIRAAMAATFLTMFKSLRDDATIGDAVQEIQNVLKRTTTAYLTMVEQDERKKNQDTEKDVLEEV